jgi:hypothetical protein
VNILPDRRFDLLSDAKASSMRIYYFHLRGAIALTDAVGRRFADSAAAESHARHLMRNFERQNGTPVKITVVDEAGEHVSSLKSRTN